MNQLFDDLENLSIERAAQEVHEFWSEYLTYEGQQTKYKDWIEEGKHADDLKPTTFIHPQDLAWMHRLKWNDENSKNHQNHQAYCKIIALLNGIENGEGPDASDYSFVKDRQGSKELFPNVAQPFMGDLLGSKVVILTFNPGYHSFSNFVLSRDINILSAEQGENLEKELRKNKKFENLSNWDESPEGRSSALKKWRTEQQKLLERFSSSTVSGDRKVFVPWRNSNSTPDFIFPFPLNLKSDGEGSWATSEEEGNWHTYHFREKFSEGKVAIRSLISDSERVQSKSDGIVQLEVFPYQTHNSDGLKNKIKVNKDIISGQAGSSGLSEILPSQIPLIKYLVSTLLNSERDGRIFITRGSARDTQVFDLALELACQIISEKSGDDYDEVRCRLQARHYKFGPSAWLTLSNIGRVDGAKTSLENLRRQLSPKRNF